MAYEAQLAGLPDDEPGARLASWLKRALKGASRPDVVSRRAAVVDALRRVGLPPIVVDGGGSGSVDFSASDPTLTEVAAGSGFLASHLFDSFAELDVLPAAFFALQVVRRPARGLVTCHGGGFVASGAVGADRLPCPVYPAGLSLTRFEGAGEVQTPLRVPSGVALGLGDPVFFRHAKAGELAEHFNEYLLVRGDRVVGRAPTYRGLGRCFLG
jgi:D-serine deaminase-like pyridoxal phosphate-dependent protein